MLVVDFFSMTESFQGRGLGLYDLWKLNNTVLYVGQRRIAEG